MGRPVGIVINYDNFFEAAQHVYSVMFMLTVP